MEITFQDIELNMAFQTKEDSIRYAGRKLVERGYVVEPYIETMIQRDILTTTYIGNGVAIPHGTDEARDFILKSGIVVLQVPQGIEYNGECATVIFGIAGKNNTHMDILSQIAIVCSNEDNVKRITNAESKEEIIQILNGK
ncbi:PTS sugar transporter subunit IIA [Erysipelothrix larvae]|nr:PTS sugar transporter subunit IIA [Erysipelothrix larvae]